MIDAALTPNTPPEMSTNTLTYFSLFSGIGGFELGIEQAVTGAKCVGFSEIDPYATRIYKDHFPGHKNFGDATKINLSTLPHFSLLCAGFPCQAFSVAGRQGGFKDQRGALFFEIARIAQARRPAYLLLENVQGLLSHDNGRTFKTVIATLAKLGYGLEWTVLDSQDFGVPQRRKRVFIIGYFGGRRRREVFPLDLSEPTPGRIIRAGEQVRDVASTLTTRQSVGWHRTIIKDAKGYRRLTPIECERLQGFPDGWTTGISDAQRYKCLGNAVTVNVIREIALRLFD